MGIFFETGNFTLEFRDKPHVSREDGGHLVIRPKKPVENRWDLDPGRAAELMKLSMIAGEAMKEGLNERGIEVERINFQDNGNWTIGTEEGPKFHLHLYGRAGNSVHQKRGEALKFPDRSTRFWEKLKPLNNGDILEILDRIEKISKREKYADWKP